MLKEKGRLSATLIARLMVLAFLILVLRQPDIVNHTQPWAEDGKVWMSDIYNDELWSSVLTLQNKYYQTISRLAYGASLAFRFQHAALGVNLTAIFISYVFIGFILSSRMAFIPVTYKQAVAAYFVLISNLSEAIGNITNLRGYGKVFELIHLRARTNKALPQFILHC